MNILLSFRIALRFIRGPRRNDISFFISIISTISIALGITVLIIGLSAMNGFERELKNRILSVVPHGEIEPINQPFYNWLSIIKRIEQIPGIIAASPYLNFTALVSHDEKFQALQIKGIDPKLELRTSSLPYYVQDNAWSNFQSGGQKIILGKGIAENLKVKSGDWLTVMIHNSHSQIKLLYPKHISLQVSGILSLNNQLDHSFAIVPLEDAQDYLQHSEEIGGISIKVSDIFQANKLVLNAGKVINDDVKIRSWISTYGYMYRDIQMIRTIIYMAMTFVIGIASFNIVSTLVIAVKNKNADIAILRTLGAKDGLISTIFIWYGLLSGLTGSLIGIIVGVLIAINLTTLVKGLEYLLGHHLLSGNIYFIDFLPTELHLIDVMSVLSITLSISLLASVYPSRNAIRINPATVLNGQ